mgnify:CR=1 FL=1
MALSHVMNIISNAGSVAAGTGAAPGGGGGGYLDSQAVTVGTTSTASGGSGAPTGTTVKTGFLLSGAGSSSISDGTSNIYSGASIAQLNYTWDTTYTISALFLQIASAPHANSGWTTLTVGSVAYLRTNALYTSNSGGYSSWGWFSGSDNTGASNPFSGTGTVTTCVFT